MKTAIHFGADALGRLRDIPYKRVLVITDPFIVKSGMIDMITKPVSYTHLDVYKRHAWTARAAAERYRITEKRSFTNRKYKKQ